MRIVVALGGNALLRRREPMSAEAQRANVRRAVAALVPLFEAGHQLVITHGNGPQVGLLALQAAAGPKNGAYPLDVLDAESEGMVGYLIEQELDNALPRGCSHRSSSIGTILPSVSRRSRSGPSMTAPRLDGWPRRADGLWDTSQAAGVVSSLHPGRSRFWRGVSSRCSHHKGSRLSARVVAGSR